MKVDGAANHSTVSRTFATHLLARAIATFSIDRTLSITALFGFARFQSSREVSAAHLHSARLFRHAAYAGLLGPSLGFGLIERREVVL
jgi:hypothetical protein